MTVLSFGKNDGLYYEYFPAGKPEGVTFVFLKRLQVIPNPGRPLLRLR
jgi:hypothetical protein